MFDWLQCLFGRHRRGQRSHVWHDGTSYRSKCRGCGKPMVRDRSGWRLASPKETGTARDGADPA